MQTEKSFALLLALAALAISAAAEHVAGDYSPLAPQAEFQLLRSKRVRRAAAPPLDDEIIDEDDNVLYTPTKSPVEEAADLEDDNNNSTDHVYYRMTVKRDVDLSGYYVDMTEWLAKKGVHGELQHKHLNMSYRRAAGVKFQFKFPFYGHRLNNLTIATGGFCYVGEYTHSWLAATQYVAPLMANFDTLHDDSSIMYGDDGEKMIVEWNRVMLRDHRKAGPFTFQAQLFKNGDIWFVYKEIPLPVRNISDAQHPCKAGVSDAYLFNHRISSDKTFQLPSHTRRIIHEYSRISVLMDDIRSNSVVILTALPTCLNITNCEECHRASLKNFDCSWCSKPDARSGDSAFCSDQLGMNRRRQDWVETCAMNTPQVYCEPSDATTHASATTEAAAETTAAGAETATPKPSLVIPIVSSTAKSAQKQEAASGGGGGFAFFTLLLIIGLSCAGWALYAFYNPHTPSGQLLIKYRPSRWQIPSSHVRYSASVHM